MFTTYKRQYPENDSDAPRPPERKVLKIYEQAPSNETRVKNPSPSTQQITSAQLFRFLDLPPELRNKIYAEVVQEHPTAHLSRRKKTHELQTTSPLILVNKQIASEFRPILTEQVPAILTQVVDFDFSHIIAFFNRLSNAELLKLTSGTTSLNRVLSVELVFTFDCLGNCYFESGGLQRWIRRLRTTKKGVDVEIEYMGQSGSARGHEFGITELVKAEVMKG